MQKLQIAREDLIGLLPIGCVPEEVINEDSVTVSMIYNSIPFRQKMFFQGGGEDAALYDCYAHLIFNIKEHMEDPEGKREKVRKAYADQWMDNLIDGVSDSRGEFVPSTKQIIERLNHDR